MTSLSYGTWIATPNQENGKPKKRIATYDKPPKQTNNNLLDVNDLDLNLSTTTSNLNDYTSQTEKKQSEIHDLLDQMNRENFDNEKNPPLVQPIAPPTLLHKSDNPSPIHPLSNYQSIQDEVSNYQTIYNKGTTYHPTTTTHPNFLEYNGDRILLEKLNYMIYLLEQQQNEKTNHILEEFLLYCFLGVFMIYIVDGFARSGGGSFNPRYTR